MEAESHLPAQVSAQFLDERQAHMEDVKKAFDGQLAKLDAELKSRRGDLKKLNAAAFSTLARQGVASPSPDVQLDHRSPTPAFGGGPGRPVSWQKELPPPLVENRAYGRRKGFFAGVWHSLVSFFGRAFARGNRQAGRKDL